MIEARDEDGGEPPLPAGARLELADIVGEQDRPVGRRGERRRAEMRRRRLLRRVELGIFIERLIEFDRRPDIEQKHGRRRQGAGNPRRAAGREMIAEDRERAEAHGFEREAGGDANDVVVDAERGKSGLERRRDAAGTKLEGAESAGVQLALDAVEVKLNGEAPTIAMPPRPPASSLASDEASAKSRVSSTRLRLISASSASSTRMPHACAAPGVAPKSVIALSKILRTFTSGTQMAP